MGVSRPRGRQRAHRFWGANIQHAENQPIPRPVLNAPPKAIAGGLARTSAAASKTANPALLLADRFPAVEPLAIPRLARPKPDTPGPWRTTSTTPGQHMPLSESLRPSDVAQVRPIATQLPRQAPSPGTQAQGQRYPPSANAPPDRLPMGRCAFRNQCGPTDQARRLNTRVPLVPPKPKLFLTATSICMSRPVFAQ